MWTKRSGSRSRMAPNTGLVEPVAAHEANTARKETGPSPKVRKRPPRAGCPGTVTA